MDGELHKRKTNTSGFALSLKKNMSSSHSKSRKHQLLVSKYTQQSKSTVRIRNIVCHVRGVYVGRLGCSGGPSSTCPVSRLLPPMSLGAQNVFGATIGYNPEKVRFLCRACSFGRETCSARVAIAEKVRVVCTLNGRPDSTIPVRESSVT